MFTRTLWLGVLLLILQALVFNHIHILGYATPLPFFYFLLAFHSDTPRWVYILWGFVFGIAVDILSNTIGECAAATTFLGLITPHLLTAFSPADRSDDGITPSAKTMKWNRFIPYVLSASVIFTSIFYIMECFSFLHPIELIINIAASSLITLVIICGIERIRMSIKG